MKKLLGIFLILAGSMPLARAADDQQKIDSRLQAARTTIDAIMSRSRQSRSRWNCTEGCLCGSDPWRRQRRIYPGR